MITFKPGANVYVKDFNGMRTPAQSLDLTVVGRTPKYIKLRDADGKDFALGIHKCQNYEWLFYEPSFMITPLDTNKPN
ncbi:hypothetical protein OAL13_00035 [bacterium]|nr:hypothetical protein [bacterium]